MGSAAQVYENGYSVPNQTPGIEVQPYLRVIVASGAIAIAASTDIEDGVSGGLCEATDTVCVVQPTVAQRIYQMTASGAIAADVDVFRADDGLVAATGAGDRVGKSLHAASGAGSIFLVIAKDGTALVA